MTRTVLSTSYWYWLHAWHIYQTLRIPVAT
eukprot:COSAG01_NODE_65761_length_272_cov_0.791908_1_plen_29_part_01